MRRRALLVALIALPTTGLGEESAGGYGPLPWTLASIDWELPADVPFESLAVDVTVDADLPPAAKLQIVPFSEARLGGQQIYAALQTQVNARARNDERHRWVGPGFLFSVFGQHALDAIRPAEGGLLESSGGQGEYVGVRRAFAWKKGTYTFQLVRMERQEIEGLLHTWVGAFVRVPDQDALVFVGALRFLGDGLVVDRRFSSYVGVYGEGGVPVVTVTLGAPVINGRRGQGLRATARYPEGVPDLARVVSRNGAAVVTVGRPVEGRKKRSESLSF